MRLAGQSGYSRTDSRAGGKVVVAGRSGLERLCDRSETQTKNDLHLGRQHKGSALFPTVKSPCREARGRLLSFWESPVTNLSSGRHSEDTRSGAQSVQTFTGTNAGNARQRDCIRTQSRTHRQLQVHAEAGLLPCRIRAIDNERRGVANSRIGGQPRGRVDG